MKQIWASPYFSLVLFLCSLFCFPSSWVESFRVRMVRWFSPIVRQGFFFCKTFYPRSDDHSFLPYRYDLLEVMKENQRLKEENERLSAQLSFYDRAEQYGRALTEFRTNQSGSSDLSHQRRWEACARLLFLESRAISAKVIYRHPSSWSNFLWVNVGERDNVLWGEKIIALGSPVLSSQYLVGVVDRVEERESRVKLLTSATLTPSVRAIRGGAQNRELLLLIDLLLQRLNSRRDLHQPPTESVIARIYTELEKLLSCLPSDQRDQYLAKGELFGTSAPLWRSRFSLLRGVGFNYDFPDQEGPARDLRSGVPLTFPSEEGRVALIKVGDLLVTTGMDGIFPEGLPVATVAHIEPLQEGGISYDFFALPCAGRLDFISEVTILPSLQFIHPE